MGTTTTTTPVTERRVMGHGGWRPGAGRKPGPGPRRHEHGVRPFHDPELPVRVILRATDDVGQLRRRSVYESLRGAIVTSLERPDFRVVHVTIQRDLLQLVCEADDRMALSRGLRGFCISAARFINVAVGEERGAKRRGKVFVDRYDVTTIADPEQLRDVLSEVKDRGTTRRALPWPRGYAPLPTSAPTTRLLAATR